MLIFIISVKYNESERHHESKLSKMAESHSIIGKINMSFDLSDIDRSKDKISVKQDKTDLTELIKFI